MDVPRSHLRFPLFDSLRGIAALSILVVHVALFTVFMDGPVYSVVGAFLAHLNVGVPFFFLLSAFLLYRPFVAARVADRDRPGFSGYARRRFLRIAPAYWAALTITAIVPGMAGAFSGNWWVYYGLLQNFPIYAKEGACTGDSYRCAIPPAWSLAVEVLFYAVLPIVIALAWLGRQKRTGSWLVPELAAISILALVSLPIQGTAPSGGVAQALNFSPIGCGLWFALGLGLASVSVWVQHSAEEPSWVQTIRTAVVAAGGRWWPCTWRSASSSSPTPSRPSRCGTSTSIRSSS
ncbi:MAG: acyltransferase family protein [Solirubrobacterales bacterium]